MELCGGEVECQVFPIPSGPSAGHFHTQGIPARNRGGPPAEPGMLGDLRLGDDAGAAVGPVWVDLEHQELSPGS